MAKELSPKDWMERIKQGQRFQQRFANSNSWPRYKDYYRHKFASGRRDIIPVNIYFSILRSMVPQVYFRNPKITITPRKPGLEAELNARIVQTLDNWLLNETGVKNEMKLMIQDSFLCGISNGVIGYDSEYGLDGSKLDITNHFSLTQFDKKGDRIEFDSRINPGTPWFLRARPEDIIWPWGCANSKNAEWYAMRVFRPLADLKADAKYSNIGDLRGNSTPRRSAPEGAVTTEYTDNLIFDDRIEWIEVWEIHDMRTGKVLAVVLDHDKFLRNDEDLLQIEGLPIETLVFNQDPDYIYGIPDARIIEPQQLELNEIRTQAMKHRRIDIIKLLIKKGVFSEEEIQKMTDENVQAVIEADLDSGLSDSVLPLNPGASSIMADLAAAAQIVQGDVREMVGFSRTAQGEYQGKTHISAEETKKVFQSLNIRLDERRDMVADLLTNVVRKFNQIIFTHWSQERVAQVVGPDGAKWWLKFTGQQIKDEYDVIVTPEEGPMMDTQTKFDMAMQAADAWAKLNQAQIAAGTPVPAEIQRLLFSQFQDSGLDIDRLLAQTTAGQQSIQSQLGGQGQTPQTPISPGQLAQMVQQR